MAKNTLDINNQEIIFTVTDLKNEIKVLEEYTKFICGR